MKGKEGFDVEAEFRCGSHRNGASCVTSSRQATFSLLEVAMAAVLKQQLLFYLFYLFQSLLQVLVDPGQQAAHLKCGFHL